MILRRTLTQFSIKTSKIQSRQKQKIKNPKMWLYMYIHVVHECYTKL